MSNKNEEKTEQKVDNHQNDESCKCEDKNNTCECEKEENNECDCQKNKKDKEQQEEKNCECDKKKEKKGFFKKESNKEIEELKKQNSSLKESLLRNQAELQNYKKRKDEEVERIFKYKDEDLIKEFLPIIDNFERAIKMDDNDLSDEVSKFLEGFKIIYTNTLTMLEKFQVKEIDADGLEFDPTYHHAVLTEHDENKPEGVILEVLQKGYMYKDRVVRPAMVKVNE